MQKYAVLMAGGSGTRLWPLSKETSPKQFIPLEDNSSMLVQTIKRLCKVVQPEQCFIITSRLLTDITKKVAGEHIPEENIFSEPDRKNTAHIAYTTLLLKRYKEGVLCCTCRRIRKRYRKLCRSFTLAFDTAERTNGLVIIGVKPTYCRRIYTC